MDTVGIIGGGVSGLAAAGLLSRKGLNIVLLEANEKLGGSCATTNLGGYIFNDGALYLAMPGVLDHVFERIGLDRQALLTLRKITSPQSCVTPFHSRGLSPADGGTCPNSAVLWPPN